MADLQLELNAPLELRIQEFKNDPEKMQDVNDFLTELFKEAQREAEQRNGNKQKGKLVSKPTYSLIAIIINSRRNNL